MTALKAQRESARLSAVARRLTADACMSYQEKVVAIYQASDAGRPPLVRDQARAAKVAVLSGKVEIVDLARLFGEDTTLGELAKMLAT
jgi:hypothetical protein